MGLRVRLNDGVELYIGDHDSRALIDAFKAALDQNKLLEIHNREGRRLWINPHSVLYVEEPTSGLGGPPGPTSGLQVQGSPNGAAPSPVRETVSA